MHVASVTFSPSVAGMLALARAAPEDGFILSGCPNVGVHLEKLATTRGQPYRLIADAGQARDVSKIAFSYVANSDYDDVTCMIVTLWPRTLAGGIMSFGAYPDQHGARMAILEAFPKNAILFNSQSIAYLKKP